MRHTQLNTSIVRNKHTHWDIEGRCERQQHSEEMEEKCTRWIKKVQEMNAVRGGGKKTEKLCILLFSAPEKCWTVSNYRLAGSWISLCRGRLALRCRRVVWPPVTCFGNTSTRQKLAGATARLSLRVCANHSFASPFPWLQSLHCQQQADMQSRCFSRRTGEREPWAAEQRKKTVTAIQCMQPWDKGEGAHSHTSGHKLKSAEHIIS